tara:strand:+ start:16380 stop:17354 length:975 start_codon:yes stop_codon:yes gene_type:complete
MIISKTPYRLSLFGGGTDYPDWYTFNKSRIISAAIDHHCYLSVKDLPPYFGYKYRVSYSRIEMISEIDDIDHPSVRNCLKLLEVDDSLTITHDGEMPAMSGVGSSSSFTVGLLNALYHKKGIKLSSKDLALQAIHVEQHLNKESVGIQDQITAAYGGINKITAGLGPEWEVEPVNISEEYIKEMEDHILLGFSGKNRIAEVQSRKQVEQIGKNKNYLNEIMDVANMGIRYIEEESDIEKVSSMLKAIWKFKKHLTSDLTNKKLDDIFELSDKNGSLGGKLMGAGGGGFFMFVVPPEKQEKFKQALNCIKVWVPFKLSREGSQII